MFLFISGLLFILVNVCLPCMEQMCSALVLLLLALPDVFI